MSSDEVKDRKKKEKKEKKKKKHRSVSFDSTGGKASKKQKGETEKVRDAELRALEMVEEF